MNTTCAPIPPQGSFERPPQRHMDALLTYDIEGCVSGRCLTTALRAFQTVTKKIKSRPYCAAIAMETLHKAFDNGPRETRARALLLTGGLAIAAPQAPDSYIFLLVKGSRNNHPDVHRAAVWAARVLTSVCQTEEIPASVKLLAGQNPLPVLASYPDPGLILCGDEKTPTRGALRIPLFHFAGPPPK